MMFDSMSYALAVNIGTDLLRNLETLPNGEYNLEFILKSFQYGDERVIRP